MSSQYFDMIDAARAYYGAGDPSYITLMSGNYTPQEYAAILRQIPGVDVTLDSSGIVRSWSYKSPYEFTDAAADAAQLINSNVQSGTAAAGNTASLNTPIGTTLDNNGKVVLTQGGTQYSGGTMAGAALTIIGGVQASVAAAATGFALGKTISSELYDIFPDFFDSHEMEYFNPEKWGEMADIWEDATGSTLVGDAIRLLYGVKEDSDEVTAYLREDQLEFFAAYLAKMGAFDTGGAYDYSGLTYYATKPSAADIYATGTRVPREGWGNIPYGTNCNKSMMFAFYFTEASRFVVGFIVNQSGKQIYWYRNSTTVSAENAANTFTDSQNNTFYRSNSNVTMPSDATPDNRMLYIGEYTGSSTGANAWITSQLHNFNITDLIGTQGGGSGIDGIGNQTGATLPSINSDTPYADILPTILNDIPYLYDNRIEIPYVDDEGNEQTIVYYPVPMPDGGENNQPTGENISQIAPFISPDNDPQVATFIYSSIQPDPTPVTDEIPDTLNPTDNPPDTGNGNSPTIITPTGNASRLWSVYNPTQAQVDAFGAWLWSSNFIDQIKKLFTDPMNAIIGIHKVFATPIVSGTGTIVCGYIDSQVASNLVGNQYTSIDCGTVNLYEYFGNVFDYYDTEVSVYLPFIGIHQLDTAFVMRASINIVYHVDVYTGACLAELRITRDGFSPVIYTFSGDCSVRYPLSSGSYMGIVSGILTAGTALMTGGATGIIGGALALSNSHTQIQKSGSLQGNTGAMGCKKPYLIISRPQTCVTDFAHYQGYGANARVSVDTMQGYFKLTDVETNSIIGATESELRIVKTLLENGVHMND